MFYHKIYYSTLQPTINAGDLKVQGAKGTGIYRKKSGTAFEIGHPCVMYLAHWDRTHYRTFWHALVNSSSTIPFLSWLAPECKPSASIIVLTCQKITPSFGWTLGQNFVLLIWLTRPAYIWQRDKNEPNIWAFFEALQCLYLNSWNTRFSCKLWFNCWVSSWVFLCLAWFLVPRETVFEVAQVVKSWAKILWLGNIWPFFEKIKNSMKAPKYAILGQNLPFSSWQFS